jgi:hypothetical protein
VIRALERALVAFLKAAQGRAAMCAAVIQRADRAFVIARDDQRTQAELAGDVIVGVRNLTLVREIDPRAAEDVPHLGIEDRRVRVEQLVHSVILHELVPVIARRVVARADAFDRLRLRHGDPRQKKSKYSSCSQSVISSAEASIRCCSR